MPEGLCLLLMHISSPAHCFLFGIGSQSSLGVLAGTMIPVVPLFGLMAFRVDLFGVRKAKKNHTQ
jgi:hypothetical protein